MNLLELTEAQWQAQVVGLASFYGWRHYHAPDNRPNARGRVQRVAPGFPDLVLVRQPEIIIAELKTNRGRLGPGQQEWLDAFAAVGDAVRRFTDEAELIASTLAADKRPTYLDELPRVEAVLWRPLDYGEVEQRLARGRRIGVLQP